MDRNPKYRARAIVAALAFAATCATAAARAQVSVADAWIRATVPQQQGTGAFMKIKSATPARVIGFTSPVAGVAEIHEMAMDNNVMKMRAVAALALPAGETVELRPGGYHLMLMDLKQRLKDANIPFMANPSHIVPVMVGDPVRAKTISDILLALLDPRIRYD